MKQTPQQQKQQPATPQPASPAPVAETPNHDLVLVAPTPELNPRNKAAAEIAKRSNAAADEAAQETMPGEAVPSVEDPAQDPEAPAEASPAEQPAPQAEATPAAPAEPAAPQALPGIDPNAEYDFVVDGVQTKIKGSQVISRVQKSEAADYRLNQASRLLEEARRTVSQAQPPAQGAPAQQPAPSQPAALDVAQLAQLIQFGTTEQAAEALRQLTAQRPDTVTQQGLQAFAQQLPRVVEAQLAFREGLAFLQKEHGDLFNDPYLRQLIVHKENEARKAGDKRTHTELYTEIVVDLRKHFNKPANSAAPNAVPTAPAAAPTIQQKQAAKAAAPAAPKLASVRLDGGAEAQKPVTREQVLDQMRRGRGQHQLTTK